MSKETRLNRAIGKFLKAGRDFNASAGKSVYSREYDNAVRRLGEKAAEVEARGNAMGLSEEELRTRSVRARRAWYDSHDSNQ